MKEEIKSVLNQKFLRYIVEFNEFSFNGNSFLMDVLCVEDKGTRDVNYRLEFSGITFFDFWRKSILERGYEVDVDDIDISFPNHELMYAKLEFNCVNFGLIITFSEITSQLLIP